QICSDKHGQERTTNDSEVCHCQHNEKTRNPWDTNPCQKRSAKRDANDPSNPRPAAVTGVHPLPFSIREFVIAHATQTDRLIMIEMRVRGTCSDMRACGVPCFHLAAAN